MQSCRFGISSDAPDDMAGLFRVWLDVRFAETDVNLAATMDMLATVLLVACGRLGEASALCRAAVTRLAAAAQAPDMEEGTADRSAAADTHKVLMVLAAELFLAVLAARRNSAPEGAEGAETAALKQEAGLLLLTVAQGLEVASVGVEAPLAETPAATEARAWGHCAWVLLSKRLFPSLRLWGEGGCEGGAAASSDEEAEAFWAADAALEVSAADAAGHGTCAVLVARTLAAAVDAVALEGVFGNEQVQGVIEVMVKFDAGIREVLYGSSARTLPTVLAQLARFVKLRSVDDAGQGCEAGGGSLAEV